MFLKSIWRRWCRGLAVIRDLVADNVATCIHSARSFGMVALGLLGRPMFMHQHTKEASFAELRRDAARFTDKLDDPGWREDVSAIDERDRDTPDAWVRPGRHASFVRHPARFPLDSEVPLHVLLDKGTITPASLFFVRNHGAVPMLSWETHVLRVGGLAPRPLSLSMADLAALPRNSVLLTLACCGNRHKEVSALRPTTGVRWGPAALATRVWGGARLADVLALAGISPGLESRAGRPLHVRFAGADSLPGGEYATSIPLVTALEPSTRLLVAYAYNGEPLLADHGHPVRLVIPGWIGGRAIKWLKSIDLIPDEATDHYHLDDNRLVPPWATEESPASVGVCITAMNVNSAIARPAHGEKLSLDGDGEHGDRHYVMTGYAYAGDGRAVARVDVTLDGGRTWRPGRCGVGRPFVWVLWDCAVPVADLAGAESVAVRALDDACDGQPESVTFNRLGLMNNAWYKVRVHREGGALVFEHPVIPSSGAHDGWAWREAGTTQITSHTADAPAAAEAIEPVCPEPTFQPRDLATHASPDSAWIAVNGGVYDATKFLGDHPGGAGAILAAAGGDATAAFEAVHSPSAWRLLETFRVGRLEAPEVTPEVGHEVAHEATHEAREAGHEEPERDRLAGVPSTLPGPGQWVRLALATKSAVTHDTIRFTLGLPSPHHRLGLPPGAHIRLRLSVGGDLVSRPYTPVTLDEDDGDRGRCVLVIKIYPHGRLTPALGGLSVGDAVEVTGPLGDVRYAGNGVFVVRGKPLPAASHLAMIAGGTGITPLYQLARFILGDAGDTTALDLLFANKTPGDVMIKQELDGLVTAHPGRFRVTYIVDAAGPDEDWRGPTGFINEDTVRAFLPPGDETGAYAVVCGPPGLVTHAALPSLRACGYGDERIVVF